MSGKSFAQGQQLIAVESVARSMTEVLEQLAGGPQQATFDQRRQMVELLIDRVVVTDEPVEFGTSSLQPKSARTRVFASCEQTISTVNLRKYQRRSTLKSTGSGPVIQANQRGRRGNFL